MPGMNGGDVTRILRQEHYSGRIVGLTGNTMSEQRDAYIQCGIDSWVCSSNRIERTLGETHHHAGSEELFTPISQLALFLLRKSFEQPGS